MTLPMLILTHGVAVFTGIIVGLILARWAIKPEPNPDRFWRGR
jgi:uncharacterized protein YneF (UPF0154 family)